MGYILKYDYLLVDGSYLSHRSIDAPFKLTSSSGLDSTMIFVFLRSLKAHRRKTQATKVIVAWESPKTPQWRKNTFSAYKQNRGFLSQSYINQVKDLQSILSNLNVYQFMSPGNEADDVIATLTSKYPDRKFAIFTKDKDIVQLITDNCHLFDGKTITDISTVQQKYNLTPEQTVDYYAIIGDKSDNIPGISGYGQKKTSKLFEKYGDISNFPESTFSKEEWKIIERNQKLMKLNTFCPLVKIDNGHSTAEEILEKYELKSIRENLDEYQF